MSEGQARRSAARTGTEQERSQREDRAARGAGALDRVRRAWRPIPALLAAALAVLVAPRASSAQPQAEEPPQAAQPDTRELVRTGMDLLREERWAEALRAFEQAEALRPDPVVTYHVGLCERGLGRLTRARKAIGKALSAGDRLPPEVSDAAGLHMLEVEARLARTRVTVDVAGAVIAVDGLPLEPSDEGQGTVLVAGTRAPGPPEPVPSRTFELVLDPGAHTFVVTGAAGSEVVVKRRFLPGSISALRLPPSPPRSVFGAGYGPDGAERSASSRGAWAGVSFGVGAAGILAGALSTVAAVRKQSVLDERCPDAASCTDASRAIEQDAVSRYAVGAGVGFGVGVIGVGVGTVLLLTDGSPSPKNGSRQGGLAAGSLRPWAAGSVAGARVAF